MRKLIVGFVLLIVLASALYMIWAKFFAGSAQPAPRNFIGTAVLNEDGSIRLDLDATSSSVTAKAELIYRVGDDHYASVRAHVESCLPIGEKLRTGVTIPLKPWPAEIDTATEIADLRSSIAFTKPPRSNKIERVGGVSADFADKVQSTVDGMPKPVRTLIDRNGVRIIAAAHLTDALPALKNKKPRGWPDGSTWDNVEGVDSSNTVVVAETHWDKDDKKWVKNNDGEGVTRHEIGHAVDAALGEFSHSKAFIDAYNKDVAKMPEDAKKVLKYFLQDGEDGGKEEAFAEIFAALNGGVSRPRFKDFVPKYFPEAAAVVKKKIDALK